MDSPDPSRRLAVIAGARMRACSIDFEENMKLPSWLPAIAAAWLSFAAAVAQAQPDPADPQAPVPAFAYRSAFRQYRSATDVVASPDAAWLDANAKLAGTDVHTGHGGSSDRTHGMSAAHASDSGNADMHGGHHHHHGEAR